MAALQISLLGPLQVSAGEQDLNRFESNKVRALFAYLLAEMDRPHHREGLAELIWCASPAQAALANLRYALADLRKVIGDEEANPHYLLISRENLQFNASSNHRLDIAVFAEFLRSGEIEKQKQGIALYQGDFLAGFPSIESDPFEEWVFLKRERFRRQAIEALRLISDHHECRGEYRQALPFARRQVELEPWLEEGHRQLMRLLALDGQRSAALAQYETCRRLLTSEMDVEPAAETNELYESIRDGRLKRVPLFLKREPPAPGDPPFKGLQYFDEADADLFFGRERLVAHLVEKIPAGEKTPDTRFLSIIGASGSGKSSLVRAGLIPALKRSRRVKYTHVMMPAEHPLESLRAALETIPPAGGRALLFVDQFEELFTLCQNESERSAFIDRLLNAAREGSIHVLIALRADFYPACAPYENLRKALSQNQEYIGPMNAAELRRAIEEPAHAHGWLFEPGLVDLLLDDIGAEGERSPEPGALPLLSHALLETWQRRSGRMLTLAGYAESGRIHGAITKTAETVFARLSPEEQPIARNIFLRLTELGDGTQETRRRVQLRELIQPPGSDTAPGRTTELVLKLLSDARLIITTEATAEVAHEALIREWHRLHEWLAENRDGLRLHRRITESAREWEAQGREAELFYRGARLSQALEWAHSHSSDLNLLERELLATSKASAEQERAEREAQRQRELEAAQQLAESERQRAEGQRHSAQQLRRRAYSLAGVLMLALALAVGAFLQRNVATREAHLAAARELALASINNLDVDSELSILLALEAVAESKQAGIPVPYEVQNALHRAIQNSRVRAALTGHQGEVAAVAFSPDGELLATAGSDGTIRLWDTPAYKELIALQGHTQSIEDIAISPDGNYLATAGQDRAVKVWDIPGGKEIVKLTDNDQSAWSVSFSAGGGLLAAAGDQATRVWNVETGRLLKTLEGQHAPVAFAPVGMRLATSGADGTTRVWNAETWEEQISLPHAANALAFHPDGERLATAMEEMKVWDLSSGEEVVSATGFTATVRGMEFSPDGSRLATGSQDGSTIIWDAETGKPVFALAGHSGAVNDVSFNPACFTSREMPFAGCGTWLATASRDGTAKVWDISPGGSRELVTLPGFSGSFLDNARLITNDLVSASEIALQTWDVLPDGSSLPVSRIVSGHTDPLVIGNASSNGMYQVTMDLDNRVKVWDTRTGEELATFVAEDFSGIAGIAVSPAGTHVAIAGGDGAVLIRDLVSAREISKTIGGPADLLGVTFSAEGSRVAISRADGTVLVLETMSGREMLTLTGHSLPVYAISFSADGKRIATGGMDPAIRVWDASSGELLLTMSGHTASVLALAFRPDGSILATASHDSTTKLWDTVDGQELFTLTGHDGWVDSLSFSPDGKRLAAGSFQDGTMRLYVLDIGELAALARSHLTRSLTPAECQKYLHRATCP